MDLDEIRKWHRLFKPNNELFEIRILSKPTISGYFYDIEEAIKTLPQYDKCQIYFTVNQVKDACSSRVQFNKFQQVQGSATSGNDISHRWWLPIDIDVERPTDVSSSDEEKQYAHKKAGEVYKFLKKAGFPTPIVCDSSSGYHIYYPLDADNTQEVKAVIEKFYAVLGDYFTDERVKIDKVVGDANRIMRLYGTFGRKGRNSEERPHRMSKILSFPDSFDRMGIEKVSEFNSKYEITHERQDKFKKTYNNNANEQFDLRKFIQEHNIEIAKELPYGNGGTKFILKECPFDSSHKAPDSALFLSSDGAIGFKCLHNSCSSYDWKAFRLHYDPHAYDYENRPPQQYMQPQGRYIQPQKKKYEIKEESPELGKKWFSMSDIKKVDLSSLMHIKTGYTELDKKIVGLYEGEITIISGSNSSGKSSWINNLILNVIQQNFKVALWSGELRPDVLKTWISLSAAGMHYIQPSKYDEGKYFVPENVSQRIDNWMDRKFFLYNNDYTNKWEQIFNDMKELVKLGVKLFILDNLFSLDIDIFEGDKNNKQKELILQLCDFVKKNKIHIILVAHPRKVTTFLRKTDISGTSDLTNAASNVFIVHRVNNDFLKTGGEFLGNTVVQQYSMFGNCIEIAKNRLYGIVDCLVGMYYEIPTRRFKNTEYEDVHYGWEEESVQQSLTYEQPQSDLDKFQQQYDNASSNLPFGFSVGEAPF